MALNTSTLRPGLLVSLKTSVLGNVSYVKRDILPEHVVEGGAEKAMWETERTIVDPVEHEAATKVRSKAGVLIRSICKPSAFGLLCPESDAPELEKAIAEARRLAEAFNATAQLSRVHIYVLTGRIAADDVEAVKAINSELKDLLSEMAGGISKLDVKQVRAAAEKARVIGQMLTPDAQARVQVAIDAARKAATAIKAAGEEAAQEIDTRAIRTITEQRTAFLEIEDTADVAAPAAPSRVIETVEA